MSLLDLKNIVECQTCGNRDVKLIAERDGGYVCKCCGVWYKKDPTEEEFREQMRCEQGYSQLSAYRFGDARDTFQRILQNNPNSINALWGLLLARFGVVFIKGFYKGVVEPIYCFPNYERMKRRYVQSEPEYAQIMDLLRTDAELRFDYEKKAEKIDDALDSYKEYKSSTERDVFICVKISAATERHPELEGRTKDYEFALKIYNELQIRGVNAFYSFVTLENDVKSDEKIWRNLVKSKKMLLIGSSEEYLESPWVKSEWKRWLHLRREEDLYVCVLHGEDESPFDILPQEISDLEPQIYTQDMQDKLIEHICKGLGMAGAENESASAAGEKERLEQERKRREAEAEEAERIRREAEAKVHFAVETAQSQKKDGKILYSNGRTEVLKYGITEIAEQAYCEKDNIVSVILPSSVTVIGAGAFDSCTSLAGIMLPSSLTVIGEWAFDKCDSLENIYYGGTEDEWRQISLSLLGNDAIENATVNFETENAEELLLSVHIDPKHDGEIVYGDGRVEVLKYGMTEIAEEAYYENKDIVSVILPNSVTSIEYDAFYECSNLASITLSSGLTSIGSGAFSGCSITDITIPNGVKKISESAFWYCSKLASITIPSSVTAIDNEAFNYCESLADVYFGGTQAQWKKISVGKENGPLKRAKVHFEGDEKASAGGTSAASEQAPATKDGKIVYKSGRTEVLKYGITEIAKKAYQYNKDIVSVVLPSGVTSIGDSAFDCCINLTSIEIPKSVTSIGDWAFNDCKSLTSIEIPESVTSIGGWAFCGCKSLTSIEIPESVTSIGSAAFSNCSSLTSIEIPGNVKEIKGNPFVGCRLQLKVSPSNKHFKVIDNNLYSIDGKTTIAYIPKENENSFSIPSGVTSIGNAAFSNCSSLTSIAIPSGVTSISEWAFYKCSSLTSIAIPSGVTSVGGWTFCGCSSLTSITIPSGVTSVGDWAFDGCSGLKDVYFNGKKAEWNKIKIYSSNDSLTNARIHFKGLFGYTK